MLDYIFFHQVPADQFVDFLKQQNIDAEIKTDDETFEIRIPEDLSEVMLNKIDEYYDNLLDMNRGLIEEEQKQNEGDYGNASVVVNLSDGSYSYADVNPVQLNKILQVITPGEFGEIVSAITNAVEKPQPYSYCQRQRNKSDTH